MAHRSVDPLRAQAIQAGGACLPPLNLLPGLLRPCPPVEAFSPPCPPFARLLVSYPCLPSFDSGLYGIVRRAGLAAIPPFEASTASEAKRKCDGATSTPPPRPRHHDPTAPTATSNSSGEVLFAPASLKAPTSFESAPFVRTASAPEIAAPLASGFQRRLKGSSRADKLAALSAVAGGATRGGSELTRKVYHSTAW